MRKRIEKYEGVKEIQTKCLGGSGKDPRTRDVMFLDYYHKKWFCLW